MVTMVKAGIRFRQTPLRIASGATGNLSNKTPAEVLGMTFLSRVGLAAGFDKDAEILEGLPVLGFGFAEIGTVTPRPQPGNDFPRLFRNPARRAIFNRMGFNGLGAAVVSENLRQVRYRLPEGFRIGVNIHRRSRAY
jgi:dihydroorotate dehydrogenase